MRQKFKILVDIIFIVLILVLCIYFLLRIFGIVEIYKVETGSMEDKLQIGDYILIVKKNDYKVGDIVTYKKDKYHVTHRIIKKNGNRVITKGDSNNIQDEEIKISNIIGKVIYHGGLLNTLIDFKYIISSGLIGLYLLSCYFGKKEETQNKK